MFNHSYGPALGNDRSQLTQTATVKLLKVQCGDFVKSPPVADTLAEGPPEALSPSLFLSLSFFFSFSNSHSFLVTALPGTEVLSKLQNCDLKGDLV